MKKYERGRVRASGAGGTQYSLKTAASGLNSSASAAATKSREMGPVFAAASAFWAAARSALPLRERSPRAIDAVRPGLERGREVGDETGCGRGDGEIRAMAPH